jgi:predicted SpoU family rRNA methylase
VSRTRKDSNQVKNTVLEVVKKNDGTFDLFLNRELDRNNIPETWLPEQLCVRFGFCGEEYDPILREVNQNGRTTIVF